MPGSREIFQILTRMNCLNPQLNNSATISLRKYLVVKYFPIKCLVVRKAGIKGSISQDSS